MQKETKPIIAVVLGIIIVILFPTMMYVVFIGLILLAIGIIDLAWITIQPPKPKKHMSKEERKETLRKIKKAVRKRK